MLRVSRKLIMFKPNKEKCSDKEELKVGFVTSNGWLTKFMKQKNLSMQRQKTIAQKDPSHLTVGSSMLCKYKSCP